MTCEGASIDSLDQSKVRNKITFTIPRAVAATRNGLARKTAHPIPEIKSTQDVNANVCILVTFTHSSPCLKQLRRRRVREVRLFSVVEGKLNPDDPRLGSSLQNRRPNQQNSVEFELVWRDHCHEFREALFLPLSTVTHFHPNSKLFRV